MKARINSAIILFYIFLFHSVHNRTHNKGRLLDIKLAKNNNIPLQELTQRINVNNQNGIHFL